MRKLIYIAVMAFSFCAQGSAVLWNGVELAKYDHGGGDADYVLWWNGSGTSTSGVSGSCSLQVMMTIVAFDNVDYCCISSYDYDQTATGVTANWLQANQGDIAEALTTRNRKYYFNHCHLDHETGWENRDIYSELDSDIYLIFAVGSTEDYNNNIPDPNCLYGWAHLEVNKNGELGLLESAIGLDGQSMIVGAIPEPSSGLLLILGLSLLSLRRKREEAKERSC